jgi:hypothetical protein
MICLLVAVSSAPASAASRETGILAFSGKTLHRTPPDPLIGFEGGRAVSLVPFMGALVRHSAADADIVLVLLETGKVQTAEDGFADVLLYDGSGIGREISKLVNEPGDALLFETPAGIRDPRFARLVRFASPSGTMLTLSFDRGFVPAPEPGLLAALVAGAMLLQVLDRRRPR